MLETITFPVENCPACARDVLVGRDLNERDELIAVCTRCGTELSGESRAYSAASVAALGYDLDGQGDGCGTGGCGSCSTNGA